MKRPERNEWDIQFKYYDGDKQALSEHYEVTLTTIYNWIHYFDDEEEEEIHENYNTEVESDVPYEEDKDFSYFVGKQKESENKPRKRDVTLRVPESCLVVLPADTHFGNIYSDVDLAYEVAKTCAKHKNVYAWFPGDLIDYEGSGPPDIKWDQAFAHPNSTRAMAEAWVREFKGSMILMTTGCHDNWTYRWTGETFVERLKKHVPTGAIFKDAVTTYFEVGDQKYWGKVGHKVGKGNSHYNPAHGGIRLAREDMLIDFVVSAHKHKPGVAVQYTHDVETVVVSCGTFKRPDDYANKKYNKKPLTVTALYFDADEHRVVPFFNWRDGIRYIQALESGQKNMEPSQ